MLGVCLRPSSYTDLDMRMLCLLALDTTITQVRPASTVSRHELGAFDVHFKQLQMAARVLCSVLPYADHRGGGGDRTYSDGCTMTFANGKLVGQGHQFSLDDVEVVTAAMTVNYTLSGQADQILHDSPVVKDTEPSINFDLCNESTVSRITNQNDLVMYQSSSTEELMAKDSACWLSNYLR
ncbi:hypothetical protein IQ06DRAFT_94694 [Phaeosphaeriaceae sp. SRC1lsM3a]|nr:hypothetical protein IQ06DRAFT_94694 [Stagonospora sp. SRC1lsM3a]